MTNTSSGITAIWTGVGHIHGEKGWLVVLLVTQLCMDQEYGIAHLHIPTVDFLYAPPTCDLHKGVDWIHGTHFPLQQDMCKPTHPYLIVGITGLWRR